MRIRKQQIITFVLGIVALAAVTVSLAYYSSGQTLDNRLVTKGSEVLLSEVFNPADKWLPGETKQKEVCFGNSGDSDQVIRFRVIEEWRDNKGDLFNWDGSYTPAVINWYAKKVSDTDWQKIVDTDWQKIVDDDGVEWYYMKSVLKKSNNGVPTMTDNPVIESVSFSDKLSNNSPGAADDFSDKRYSLKIEMQTLAVSNTLTNEAWHTTFSVDGETLTWE